MFGFKRSKSGDMARRRLLAVVSRDRASVTAEFMLKMTTELIAAATRYIETDYTRVQVTIERSPGGAVLQARVPITGYRTASA